MLLMIILIIAMAVCYITKYQVFSYRSILHLYVFLPFLSASTSFGNFHSFSTLIFPKKNFTNFCSNMEKEKPILNLQQKKLKVSPVNVGIITT